MTRQRGSLKNFPIERACVTQICLSKKVILEDRLPRKIATVAGVDVSYVSDTAVGAVVVLNFESLNLLEAQIAVCKVKMPYVPTLLSFRETPPALAAIRKLKIQPEVFIVDAQGRSHPRRCGFASHLGLVLNKPTIGAAKTRLIGEPTEIDGQTFLVDEGEVVGTVVTTKLGAKPIFVSIGHMVSLERAVEIVRHCSKERIPEPTLQAHKLATNERNRLSLKSKVNIAQE